MKADQASSSNGQTYPPSQELTHLASSLKHAFLTLHPQSLPCKALLRPQIHHDNSKSHLTKASRGSAYNRFCQKENCRLQREVGESKNV